MAGQCNRDSGKAALAFPYGMPARNNQFEMSGAKEYSEEVRMKEATGTVPGEEAVDLL